MVIVVRDKIVGTFNWEIPKPLEQCFERMISSAKELGWSEKETNETLQNLIEYLQNSIHPLLCLLSSSVLSGPLLFSHQSEVICDGIERMALEIGATFDAFSEGGSGLPDD